MGYDGHIQVFDWKKVKEKFPDAQEKLVSRLGFVQIMKTPDGQEFEVFSGYWGDNFDYVWDDILFLMNFREKPIPEEKVEEFKERCNEIITWMYDNALLFKWEIWT